MRGRFVLGSGDRGGHPQRALTGPVGNKLSYLACMGVSLNRAGPWVDLGVEHMLPGSMSKAWECWEDRAGVRLSQAQGWKRRG